MPNKFKKLKVRFDNSTFHVQFVRHLARLHLILDRASNLHDIDPKQKVKDIGENLDKWAHPRVKTIADKIGKWSHPWIFGFQTLLILLCVIVILKWNKWITRKDSKHY